MPRSESDVLNDEFGVSRSEAKPSRATRTSHSSRSLLVLEDIFLNEHRESVFYVLFSRSESVHHLAASELLIIHERLEKYFYRTEK